MKMEYILIKKEKIKKIEKETENVIVIVSSPLRIIEKNFEKVNINKVSDEDEEMLRSKWDGHFFINDIKAIFSIKQYSKHKLSYLSIDIKDNHIGNMELVDEKINTIMANSYIVITSYDCISEFYCNKIYKKLNNFERKLKELLFDIYTFSYGMNYYEKNFSKDLKSKVKKLRDKSISSETKDIEQLKQSLYALDYNDIMELLFTPKWLEEDERDKLNLIKKIDEESLSNKELINCINSIRPKSDWDRLFLPQIGEILNIEESIDQLRELRNRVAHCKFFRKEHYEKCIILLKILNKQINKALKIVMAKDFQELNAEYASIELHKAIEILSEGLQEIGKSINEMVSNSIKQMASMAMSPIASTMKEIASTIKTSILTYPLINCRYTIKSYKRVKDKKYIKRNNKK